MFTLKWLLSELNELYNILDLYSFIKEGGPQAVVEWNYKTPLISTDVGFALTFYQVNLFLI